MGIANVDPSWVGDNDGGDAQEEFVCLPGLWKPFMQLAPRPLELGLLLLLSGCALSTVTAQLP